MICLISYCCRLEFRSETQPTRRDGSSDVLLYANKLSTVMVVSCTPISYPLSTVVSINPIPFLDSLQCTTFNCGNNYLSSSAMILYFVGLMLIILNLFTPVMLTLLKLTFTIPFFQSQLSASYHHIRCHYIDVVVLLRCVCVILRPTYDDKTKNMLRRSLSLFALRFRSSAPAAAIDSPQPRHMFCSYSILPHPSFRRWKYITIGGVARALLFFEI